MSIEREILRVALEADFRAQIERSLSDEGMVRVEAAITAAFSEIIEANRFLPISSDGGPTLTTSPRAPRYVLAVHPAISCGVAA